MATFRSNDSGRRDFCWLSSSALPTGMDLRQFDWHLAEGAPRSGQTAPCIALVDVSSFDSPGWIDFLAEHPLEARRAMIAVGVDCASTRSTLLHIGFGEALGTFIEPGEVAARAARVAEAVLRLPRQREIAGLTLDLLAREAVVSGKSLALNPREFALIWRLSDSPNLTVSKEDLIHDVWRMGFVPETNSIAVHMSRLRRKLAVAGLAGMVQTVSSGGYCLRTQLPEVVRKPRYGNAVRISARHIGETGRSAAA